MREGKFDVYFDKRTSRIMYKPISQATINLRANTAKLMGYYIKPVGVRKSTGMQVMVIIAPNGDEVAEGGALMGLQHLAVYRHMKKVYGVTIEDV